MKRHTHFITSTYFISLIKSWLQGTRTRTEIVMSTADVLQLSNIESTDITYLLTTIAREMNENFYTDIVTHINYDADTLPTREGLIHHLRALLAERITLEEFKEWALWYSLDDEQLSAGIFEDYIVEYFCLDFLPANDDIFSPYMCKQVLDILEHSGSSVTQQRVALTLLPDHELEDFKQFLVQSAVRRPSITQTDQYLLKKFGMDHESFPYTYELTTQGTEAVLKKAQLITT